ncbi:hypothetical protein [Microbacterium sp. LWH10-1.2]|uniref:hypothetical protein n=1 Tax=unclassified Microbacterium TaxID=2609290 RepID=UPI0031386DC2
MLEELVQQLIAIGFSGEAAREMVWVASGPGDLTGREFNIISQGDGAYGILKPSDRAGFFPALADDGVEFSGTLDQAFEYVLVACGRRKSSRSI